MNSKRWNLLLGLLLLVGLAWIWVNRVPGDGASAAADLPSAPAVGYLAPELRLVTLTGEPFALSDLRGAPVVLNFWATWCPPCRAELPEFQAASKRLAGQVAIIGVNQAEVLADVNDFADRMGLTFPIPLDERGSASRLYAVRSLPTTFFIDRQGVIRHVQVGPVTEATLAQMLKMIYP